MKRGRICSRSACTSSAVATLTYDYADSTAVLGPLSTQAEPHAYDLCADHAERLSVPRGWQVVRLAGEYAPAPPSEDDLSALADAVREASRRRPVARAAERRVTRPSSLTEPPQPRRRFEVVDGGAGE